MYSQIIKEGFLNLGIVKIPNSTLKPFPLTNRGTFHKRLTKRVTVLRRFTQKCAVTCKRTTSLCRLRK